LINGDLKLSKCFLRGMIERCPVLASLLNWNIVLRLRIV